jgi:MFS family permease
MTCLDANPLLGNAVLPFFATITDDRKPKMTSMATKTETSLPWLILICGSLIALLTFGPRSAMGFFQLPLLETRGWDRTTFGLAMAIQNLAWGLGQPLFGAMADRIGTWRVLAIGAISYCVGLILMAHAESALMLEISGGVLVGIGVAAGSFTIVMAAFARNVPPKRRTLVFGIGTAAGSAGMAFFSPVTVAMIGALGWQDTLVWFGMAMLVIPLLAIPLAGNSATSNYAHMEREQSLADALREALGHQSYVLLVCGFFVCGFQVAFITAHFPAYLNDIGIDARWAGIALMLIGILNIVGSLGAGFIGQIYSKPKLLAYIYLLRAIVIALFLLAPPSPASVILFACAMGVLWLSTVPLTSGLVAVMFGTRHLGTLGGIVFLSHQLGSFSGVWLGGYLYDIYGSFDPVWWLGVVLALVAAVVHLPIREEPAADFLLAPAD